MRLGSILLAVFVVPATLGTAWAQAQPFPYDPYPWCAVYGGRAGGASNCGFRTWEQCMATVSGIGGFCQPNQFYNPRGGTERPRKKQPR
jgi:hypothetical protein